jgi:hypothetical protein
VGVEQMKGSESVENVALSLSSCHHTVWWSKHKNHVQLDLLSLPEVTML